VACEVARIVTPKLDGDGRNCALNGVDVKFMWMIGVQFATLMAVIAALLNVYFR